MHFITGIGTVTFNPSWSHPAALLQVFSAFLYPALVLYCARGLGSGTQTCTGHAPRARAHRMHYVRRFQAHTRRSAKTSKRPVNAVKTSSHVKKINTFLNRERETKKARASTWFTHASKPWLAWLTETVQSVGNPVELTQNVVKLLIKKKKTKHGTKPLCIWKKRMRLASIPRLAR